MKCPYCDKELSYEDKFCPNCGKPCQEKPRIVGGKYDHTGKW